MVFSSIEFIYYFLPIVLGLYFIVPFKVKNLVLLLASLFFYFYGEQKLILVMIFSSVSGYLHGLWIHEARNHKYASLPLVSSLIVGLAPLIYFKYTNFFIINVNQIFDNALSKLNVVMPIGISFYTFQILSYTIDVYHGEAKVQKNILNFITYVTLFPQLIAGPIVRYTTVQDELSSRKHSFEDFSYGVRRFVIGLSKKVLLANTLAELGKTFSYSTQKSVFFYWLVAIAFMLQIYFDFSGYSDMAIGLGRIFGFHFLENFNYPFISKSITEFWRRWHISLGTWFRDYVYIPMGGNRVSKIKWLRNILVVWFLTGFWHGAEWNFIAWGVYFSIFLVFEKLFLGKILNKLPRFISHLYLIFFITISFVVFNADGLGEAVENLKGMFGLLNVPISNYETIYHFRNYAFVILIGAFAATPIASNLTGMLVQNDRVRKVIYALEPIAIILLLLTVTGYLVDGSFNPFIYFRF